MNNPNDQPILGGMTTDQTARIAEIRERVAIYYLGGYAQAPVDLVFLLDLLTAQQAPDLAPLTALVEETMAFLRSVEWTDHASETAAHDLREQLAAAIAALTKSR